MTKRYAVLILFILWGVSLQAAARDENLFPRPAAIEHDVQFWKRVYTEISTNEGFIHDDKNLSVVYEKIRLPEDASYRTRQRYVKRIKRKYYNILKTLSHGKRSGLSAEQQRVLNLWPNGVSNKELRRAKNRIRFQLGQSNKFRAGLIRSGAWKSYIKKTLQDMGLPTEISALPHVESSFNHKAYSKVGAAGMWQFMRGTGRRFMRIDHVVDERMDPFKATIAAARLLENNYAVTGAWPLAITAYNHGAAGMRRAAAKLGSTDIVTVLRKYKSRSFGFASRNFYVAFLAAVEIDSDPEKYFGKLNLDPPVDYEIVTMPAYMSVDTVANTLNLNRSDLRESNLALRPSVWNGNKYIPKGYELKIERKYLSDPSSAQQAIAKVSSKLMYAKQRPDRYHRVRRGQTLSTIAARYGVRMNDLIALNNLRSRHRIRVGQVLRLPQPGKRYSGKTILVAEKRSPKVEPRAIPESGSYKVRRGDTIASIARRYGVSTRELQTINNIRNRNRIYPGQRLILAQAEGDVHVVRRGDTIDKIALRYGKDTSEILALNHLRNKNRIYPGQKLILAKADTGEVQLPKTKDTLPSVIDAAIADEAEGDPTASDETVATPENTQAAKDQNVQLAKAESNTQEMAEQPSTSRNAEKQVAQADNLSDEQTMKAILGVSVDGSVPPPAIEDNTDGEDSPLLLSTLDSNIGQQGDDNNIPSAVPIGDNGPTDTNIDEPGESLGDTVISESDSETDLLADPTDYSVSKRNTIEVQAAETLGHYAEWLQLRASQLRRVNRMRYGKPVVIGKRLKLIFSKVTPEEFEEQRVAYHRALQEEFFEQYQITGSDKHKIRRGQSVWKLAKRKYKIPIWLLRQYNPDLDMDKVRPGTIITFPKIAERSDENLKADHKTSRAPKTVVATPLKS